MFREQVPRRHGENNTAYARRLHMAYPQLTLREISRLSGATEGNLRQDPAFQTLPAHLAPIREQVPQLDGENNAAYARRLHLEHPQLTVSEISLLSGVTEGNLKQDPAFGVLPAYLVPIREQVSQRGGESNIAYARRLHMKRPQLTLLDISQLSGVKEVHLKKDPAFRAPPAYLTPIREQVPQLDGENNAAYARRLHMVHPQLNLPDISQLSGVKEVHLKQDPAFQAPPAHLVPIREQFPQRAGEKNMAYARRLHLELPQLTLPDISKLSGVRDVHVKQDPAFRVLPAHLVPIREQVPQRDGENNAAYAHRLHVELPQLTLPEISLLSGVTEGNLKRNHAFGQTPTLPTSVEHMNSDESSARRPRPLKRTAIEAAAAQPVFHEASVRSLRSRLTEPRETFTLGFDAQARLYLHDRQTALMQVAPGATAAATPGTDLFASGAEPFPGPLLQEYEVEDMIRELLG